MLSWLISGNVKSKQMFIKNRLQDIKQRKSNIQKRHNVDWEYLYLTSENTPADLVTQALTFKKNCSKAQLMEA